MPTNPTRSRATALAQAVFVGGASLLLANCGANTAGGTKTLAEGVDSKYGVKASPRVVADGQPVPKGGGVAMVGRPYKVAQRTYVPADDPRYSRVGLASWYGAAFHGRLTANGEVFDKSSYAAAHPTMPLPSYARVTNLANGRSMIVRVNDRGPYHAGRVMDVSERVAEALEFRRAGTAKIKVDYVRRASLNGSDDEKLLATLREGTPARLEAPAPTMVADAAPKPATAAGPLRAEPHAEPVRVAQLAPPEPGDAETPGGAENDAEVPTGSATSTPVALAFAAPTPPSRPLHFAAAKPASFTTVPKPRPLAEPDTNASVPAPPRRELARVSSLVRDPGTVRR